MPVAGTATAQDPAMDAEQPVSRRGRSPNPPHFLSALQPELRDEVAHRLAPRDIVRLTATYQQAKMHFADARTAAERVMEAQNADLATIDRLLNGPDSIADLSPRYQATSRMALAQRLGDLAMQVKALPEPDRPAGFSALLVRSKGLGVEGSAALTLLAMHVADLPQEARHEAFRDVADRIKQLPDEHADRLWATTMLHQSIPALPEENRDDATRWIVELLRPLTDLQRKFVMDRDNMFSPAIKEALRQAVAKEGAASPSRPARLPPSTPRS